MDDSGPIILAHVPDFSLGMLTVRPATRELVHPDGRNDVLEPRVMQVLVALARAKGGAVTRDELTSWCWEGRIVGEDAINRVLSRLRRAAEGIGAGSFRIETLTKVGYRLITVSTTKGTPLPADPPAPEQGHRSRRTLLVAGGALVGAAAVGGVGFALLGRQHKKGPPTPEVAALIQQATSAYWQSSIDGGTQAQGLMRQVTELAPDYADGWGMFAVHAATSAHYGAPSEVGRSAAYAREAIAKANQLDPGNVYAGLAATILAGSIRQKQIHFERALRRALIVHPEDRDLGYRLASLLNNVGRTREATAAFEKAFATRNPEPGIAYLYGQALWAADRLDDADRWIDKIYAAYPRHFAVWFTRFYYLMYTARCDLALAMARDLDTRPMGIPDEEFDLISKVAIALQSRAPADIETAVRGSMASAPTGAGRAENAMQFTSALGRVDDAFTVAEAYYFGRGFDVGALRFTRQQGAYTPVADRRTWFLFMPSTAAMRADPRFAKLTEEIGLNRYWREAGVIPDFRRR